MVAPNTPSGTVVACTRCQAPNRVQMPTQQRAPQQMAPPVQSSAGSFPGMQTGRTPQVQRPISRPTVQNRSAAQKKSSWRPGPLPMVPLPLIRFRYDNYQPTKTPQCNGCMAPMDGFLASSLARNCRNCGLYFCSSCADQSAWIPDLCIEQSVTVCKTCGPMLQHKRPDKENANNCTFQGCGYVFTLTDRHHCRQCGRSVCERHGARKFMCAHLGYKDPQRLCDNCYVPVRSMVTSVHQQIEQKKAMDRASGIAPPPAQRQAAAPAASSASTAGAAIGSAGKMAFSFGKKAFGQLNKLATGGSGTAAAKPTYTAQPLATAQPVNRAPAAYQQQQPYQQQPPAGQQQQSAATTQPAAAPGQGQSTCVICLDAPADHAVLLCMHVCVCQQCGNSGLTGCPICREPVTMVKKVFLS